MGYLGNTPGENFITFSKQVFTIVNSQTAYTLNFSVVDENELRLVINNVVQEPGAGKAYTASGTTLTLTSALTNGTDEMYCVFLGKARETVTVPTITKDKLNLISNATAGLTVKGDGGSNDGYLQLNCSQNSHGVKIKSPPHSAGQSYTLTLPQSITNNTFLKTDGSGNLSFATVSTGFTLGTPVSTNSGSEIDFTGIPSTATFVILNMQFVSLSGSDHIRIQLGTSSGVATSGYDMGLGEIGSSSTQGISNGLPMYLASAGRQVSSTVFITLSNSSNNTYNMSSVNYRRDSAQMQIAQGSITLSGVLDRVRIETTGSNTFDGGTANIMFM